MAKGGCVWPDGLPTESLRKGGCGYVEEHMELGNGKMQFLSIFLVK